MQFPRARKYLSGFIREVEKGRKYRLVLKYKDDQGNWVSKPTKTVNAKNKTEAKELLKEFQKEMERMVVVAPNAEPSNSLTMEVAIREYLTRQLTVTHTIGKSTYDRQLPQCEKRVFPYIGKIKIDEFSVDDIEDWWTELANDGLKQSTIHATFAIPNKVLGYHVKRGDIAINPFSRMTERPKRSEGKVTHLTLEQTEQMIISLNEQEPEGSAFWTAINVATLAGLRRSEICGLRWLDIDFGRGLMTVSSAIGRAKGGSYTKNPKSESSKRTFPMMPQLVDVLRAREEYVKQEEEVEKIPSKWFVVGNREEFLIPEVLGIEARKFFDDYEITDYRGNPVTLHALRHSFATQAIASHVDVKSVQRMLGHANATMTLDIYANSDEDALKVGVDKLASTFDLNTEVYGIFNEESRRHLQTALVLANVQDVSVAQLVRCIEMIQNGDLVV